MIDKLYLQHKIDELEALLNHSRTAYEYEKAFEDG